MSYIILSITRKANYLDVAGLLMIFCMIDGWMDVYTLRPKVSLEINKM